MVLDAADSTVGGMLSLNVNVSRRGAGASSSWSCALVMNCGAGTMQEHHTRSLLKSQGSSRSCMQDTALGVHYGRNVVVAWKRSPVAVPGRDRRFRQSHPTVSCSPCHVYHKSVGGRLLKTQPWPATRKALQSTTTSPTRTPHRSCGRFVMRHASASCLVRRSAPPAAIASPPPSLRTRCHRSDALFVRACLPLFPRSNLALPRLYTFGLLHITGVCVAACPVAVARRGFTHSIFQV